MGIVVQKFGGTSVASIQRILQAIPKIQKELAQNNQVVVVVSAMAGFTNSLLEYCRELSIMTTPEQKFIADFVLCNGENITCGLMAMALNAAKIPAIPLQGWQIPILTDNQSSEALITEINANIILSYLNKGFTPIICGFQGICHSAQFYDKSVTKNTTLNLVDDFHTNKKITTLGRGGSDITAVAVAASLKAIRCDIYTDVAGIYTADPRIITDAKKISTIEHDVMLEFSYLGAKIMHPRSIELAKAFQVKVNVLSSFEDIIGSQIISNTNMELSKIIGIACDPNILSIKISSKKPLPLILMLISKFGINVYFALNNNFKITLICGIEELAKLEKILHDLVKNKSITNFDIKSDVALVGIIGTKLLNEKCLITRVLEVLSNFDIEYFHPDHSKITVLLKEEQCQKLQQELHRIFIKQSINNKTSTNISVKN